MTVKVDEVQSPIPARAYTHCMGSKDSGIFISFVISESF